LDNGLAWDIGKFKDLRRSVVWKKRFFMYEQLLRDLSDTSELPVDAIRRAETDRDRLIAPFIAEIDRFVALPAQERARPNAIFFLFHMLGSWKAKPAYRSLAGLLRIDPDDLDLALGDAIAETSHRVMAAVFDGDPVPLFDIILDADADETIRARMCEALAMVSLRNELPVQTAAEFLESAFFRIQPTRDNQVWLGWKNAIAMLGLSHLKPFVRKAFERGAMEPELGTYRQFEEEDIAYVDNPPQPRPAWMEDEEYTLFGDTLDELSKWEREPS